MPAPNNGVGVQNPVHKGGSITFTDYKGRRQSTALKSAGGDVSRGDMEDLANLIAACSNASYNKVEIHNRIEWKDSDLIFYDEAEGSVEQVIVIVLLHDTDSSQNQEVLIPAYDASMLVPSTSDPDLTNAALIAVAERALEIVNDDDNIANPDNYNGWRAYTTTRKTSGGKSQSKRNLPAPIEPPAGAAPPDAPAIGGE